MRKSMLMIAALAAGAISLNGAAAQQTKQQGHEDMKVTGMVTEVDQQSHEITVGGKTFVMADSSGGAAMMPQVGAEITLFYRDEGDQKLITRIGQAQ